MRRFTEKTNTFCLFLVVTMYYNWNQHSITYQHQTCPFFQWQALCYYIIQTALFRRYEQNQLGSSPIYHAINGTAASSDTVCHHALTSEFMLISSSVGWCGGGWARGGGATTATTSASPQASFRSADITLTDLKVAEIQGHWPDNGRYQRSLGWRWNKSQITSQAMALIKNR